MPPTRPEAAPSLAQLKLEQAQLRANLPSDEEFEALLSAQAEAQREQRAQRKAALAQLDSVIAELDA